MKLHLYDLAGIIVLFLGILLLMNWGSIFPQAPSEDCFTRERLHALNATTHILVIEGRIYNISGWENTSYPSGVSVLAKELTEEEWTKVSAPVGILCESGLEDVNYGATLGVTDATKDLVAGLVNSTIDGIKEDYKMTANEDNATYMGWHIRSRTILKETVDVCDPDTGLIFSDQPPDISLLLSCGRRAFAAGGGNVTRVYIIRSNATNTFYEPLLLEFNAMSGYERLERYTG